MCRRGGGDEDWEPPRGPPRQAGHTGEYTDATGGYGFYASPGVRWALGANMSLYGYYQVPLYEYLNQIQLTADRNLLFGLDCQLDVF